MATSPHVCCPDCLVFTDGFDRTGPDLGCEWESLQGNWSLVDGQLHESGNAGALILSRRPASSLSFCVSVGIPAVVSGAVYRLIANYKDSNNYFYADFVFTSSGLAITLYRRFQGNDDLLKTKSWLELGLVGEPNGLMVCLTDENFTACASVPEGAMRARCAAVLLDDEHPLIADGFRAGIGNGSGTALDYDDFRFEETRRTNPDTDCRECKPLCCVPYGDTLCDSFAPEPPEGWELVATFSSDCELLDGQEVILTPGTYGWEGADSDCLDAYLTLSCDHEAPDEPPCKKYRLTANLYSGADCQVSLEEDSCSCAPFQLVYTGTWYHIPGLPECPCPCPDGSSVTLTITCPSAQLPVAPAGAAERSAEPPGAAPQQFPPLHRQAWNLARSLADFVADGCKTVSQEQYAARLAICETCDQRRGNRCLVCGCQLLVKARGRAFRCPLDKWPAAETP